MIKLELDSEQLDPSQILNNITSLMCEGYLKHLEGLLTEGLIRKGFEFKTKIELESFVKENCRCEVNTLATADECVYYVNDIPFFCYFYDTNIVAPINFEPSTMTVKFGSYSFL